MIQWTTKQRTTSRVAGLLAVAVLIFGPTCGRAEDSGPSFDCAKAETVAEKVICGNPQLADMDRVLAETYEMALAEVGPEKAKALKEEQREWLFRSGICCGRDPDPFWDNRPDGGYKIRRTRLCCGARESLSSIDLSRAINVLSFDYSFRRIDLERLLHRETPHQAKVVATTRAALNDLYQDIENYGAALAKQDRDEKAGRHDDIAQDAEGVKRYKDISIEKIDNITKYVYSDENYSDSLRTPVMDVHYETVMSENDKLCDSMTRVYNHLLKERIEQLKTWTRYSREEDSGPPDTSFWGAFAVDFPSAMVSRKLAPTDISEEAGIDRDEKIYDDAGFSTFAHDWDNEHPTGKKADVYGDGEKEYVMTKGCGEHGGEEKTCEIISSDPINKFKPGLRSDAEYPFYMNIGDFKYRGMNKWPLYDALTKDARATPSKDEFDDSPGRGQGEANVLITPVEDLNRSEKYVMLFHHKIYFVDNYYENLSDTTVGIENSFIIVHGMTRSSGPDDICYIGLAPSPLTALMKGLRR